MCNRFRRFKAQNHADSYFPEFDCRNDSLSVPFLCGYDSGYYRISFIGLGLGDNVVDWGSMILDARGALVLHPTMILYPIGAVILSTLCFNVIGRQLTTKEAE